MQPNVQEQLAELIYEDAQQEAIAAEMLANHWKNSPHRVLSLAEQQLQVEGFPVQPVLLKFRYWGDRSIEFNFSRLWDFLCPITFCGVVVRLSLLALFLEYGAFPTWEAVSARSLDVQQVQASQKQE